MYNPSFINHTMLLDRQTHRPGQTHTQTRTDRHTHRPGQTETELDRQRQRWTDSQTELDRHIDRAGQTYRQSWTDIQTELDRQDLTIIERQTDLERPGHQCSGQTVLKRPGKTDRQTDITNSSSSLRKLSKYEINNQIITKKGI